MRSGACGGRRRPGSSGGRLRHPRAGRSLQRRVAAQASSSLARGGAIVLATLAVASAGWLHALGRPLPDASLPLFQAIQREVERLQKLDRYLESTHWVRGGFMVASLVLILGAVLPEGGPARAAAFVLFLLMMEIALFRPRVRQERAKTRELRENLESWLRGIEAFELADPSGDPKGRR